MQNIMSMDILHSFEELLHKAFDYSNHLNLEMSRAQYTGNRLYTFTEGKLHPEVIQQVCHILLNPANAETRRPTGNPLSQPMMRSNSNPSPPSPPHVYKNPTPARLTLHYSKITKQFREYTNLLSILHDHINICHVLSHSHIHQTDDIRVSQALEQGNLSY